MKNTPLLCLVFTLLASYNECQSQTNDADPYLWLEEVEGQKPLDWVKAENALSDKVIATQPIYKPLQKRYLDVFNSKDRIMYPDMVGDYVYNLLQDEQYERGLWRRILKSEYIKGATTWETVLDIDALASKENKKWVFSGAIFLEPDNQLCLLGLSDGGKDENEYREFNAQTKTFVEGGFFLKESKGSVSWIDRNTVLLSRNFGEGTMTTSGYPKQVRLLERKGIAEKAPIVFETVATHVSTDPFTVYSGGKLHTFVSNYIKTFQQELFYVTGKTTKKVNLQKDANFVGLYQNQLLVSLQSDWTINNKTYKQGSLVSVDLDKNLSGTFDVEVIYEPNAKSTFVSAMLSKDFVVVNTLENVQSKIINFKRVNGKWSGEKLHAPDFGSIHLVASDNITNDYFFMYSDFITPTTLYYADDQQLKTIKQLKNNFNADNLVIEQFAATSKDGTSIPYFIVHRKDMARNGQNPTLIEAYGGFNNPMQADYSSVRGIGWLEKGGIYVLANIRGGGEFGPSWHQAAMKEKKQNSYDDFFAVTEDLIAKKITTPKFLGAFGWSNGGLLMGAVFTQHPELYNAVVIGAPLLDMKRYSKMLAGASWMGEYGDPDVAGDWEYIKKYSPYHNLSKDKQYPEAYFVTSTKDDRVHPGHARKMAAKMQDMKIPFLYHETIEGGHGAASTNDQQADVYAGIFTYFNMKLNPAANK